MFIKSPLHEKKHNHQIPPIDPSSDLWIQSYTSTWHESLLNLIEPLSNPMKSYIKSMLNQTNVQ